MVTAGESPTPRSRSRGGRWGWTAAAAAACLALSLLLGARESGLLRTSLSYPLVYASVDDAKFYLALIKGIIDHGWWTHNPSLGFPFGQQLYDFPQGGDNLNLLVIRALGAFSSNPAWVANVFLLLTFPAAALSAFAVLRRLTLSRAASVTGAVIFALLPYHFWRGESQLLLSAYYSVPLSVYLFLALQGGVGLFARRDGPARMPWLGSRRRTVLTMLVCLIVGSAGLYYAAFSIVLIIAGALVRLVVIRRASAVVPSLVVTALIALTLGANLAPSLIYRAEHGSNQRIHRTVPESQRYGLELAGLVLPVREHRLVLSDLNARAFDSPLQGYCEQCYETLGTVGDVGFAWLVVIAIASVLGFAGLSAAGSLERRAALGVALCLLIATVGGVSGLIALLITSDIRGWNRMSLFIAFLSLLAAGLLLDRAGRRLRVRGLPAWAGSAVIGGVLVFGVLDETSRYFLPQLAPTQLKWRSDATFIHRIEASMPRRAAIFQIPQVPFPEGYAEPPYAPGAAGGGFSGSYELMRGYLHSTTLRWSYGAMKGRPADWASQLVTKPLEFVADTATIDGFDGLWVDLAAYSRPRRAPIRRKLTAITGQQPRFSPLHDLAFYDLRPLRSVLTKTHPAGALRALRNRTLHPLRTTCTATGLQLTNPSATARPAALTYTLSAPSPNPRVLVRYPDGTAGRLTAGHRLRILKHLNLRPGTQVVRFSYAGHQFVPQRHAHGPEILTPDLTEPALTQFENASTTLPNLQAGLTPPPCIQIVPRIEPSLRDQ